MNGYFRQKTLVFAVLLFPVALFAQGFTCPTFNSNLVLNTSGVTHCYYIDIVNGSDSSAGSKASPWQHDPGMANWTGSAHTPVAGEGHIFIGGETWPSASWPMQVPWNGSSSNPSYVGVDQTWFTGSSWSRPIFNGGGSTGYVASTHSLVSDYLHSTAYIIIDNIEFTGLYFDTTGGACSAQPGSCSYVTHDAWGGSPWEIANVYGHKWSHSSPFVDPASNTNLFNTPETSNAGSQSYFHDSVVDGSDASKDCCGASGATIQYHNYIAWVDDAFQSGIGGPWAMQYHDNTIWYNPGSGGDNGVHSNCFHPSGAAGGGWILFYNNIDNCTDPNNPSSTAAEMFLNELVNTTEYAFNNIFMDSGQANGISLTNWGSGNAANTYYFFNNTIEASYDPTPGGKIYDMSFNSVSYVANNFAISNNASDDDYNTTNFSGTTTFLSPASTTTCSGGAQKNLGLTQICAPIGTGNGTGNLNFSQTYPFWPQDSKAAALIGTGQNNSAYCTAISALNAAAGTACLSDTTAGVGYDTTNHTVIWPNRTPMARSSWYNGAYEFGQGPNPPTGLTASVN
jgi:hypothetical protein